MQSQAEERRESFIKNVEQRTNDLGIKSVINFYLELVFILRLRGRMSDCLTRQLCCYVGKISS